MSIDRRLVVLPAAFGFCAARALGRTVKRNKLVSVLAFAAIALWASAVDISGINSGVFELDGDAVTNHNLHDWDQVYAGTSGALASGFDPDKFNDNTDNIFQGGGSKDTLGIQSGQWLWTSGKPQGKDDLEHSYSAAYTLSNGDLAIFVGADRYDNSGDSTIAFWFFQDGTVGTGGAKKGGGTTFTGQHKSGDLLLISDFTIGGSTSTIHAYEWQGDDATGTLVDKGVLSTTQGFAIVNSTNQTSPWPFTDKANTAGGGTFAPGEFFEGGVDLNAIYGANLPCFTTFMAETRSSQSPTATLSDFTPPRSFPLCGISIAKACSGAGTISADGSSITYNWTGTVHNTGIATLSNIKITDSLPDGNTSFPTLYQDAACSTAMTSLGPNGSGTDTGHYCVSFVATKTNVSNPLSVTNSTTVTAQDSAGDTISSSKPGSDTCSTSPADSIAIYKQCGQPYQGTTVPGVDSAPDPSKWTVPGTTLVATGGVVEANVNFSAKVCNTGTSGASGAIGNISIVDYPGATSSFTLNTMPDGTGTTVTSLGPGQCAFTTGTYTPSAIDSTSNGKTNGRYTFSDQISITSATPTLGTLNPVVGCKNGTDLACSAATCAICFGGSCQ